MKEITYVGLDVHQRNIAIAELPAGVERPVVREIPNDPKLVRRTLQWLKKESPGLRCCYEAGPCGFELKRMLDKNGIACEVIAPALIPRKPGERIKTDQRDAAKLARLYRAGELTAIRVPTSREESVRDLVRAREDVRNDLIAARHRLAKFLLRHGRIFSDGKNWTERHFRWLRAQTFEHAGERTTFEHYLLQVDHLIDRRARLEAEIATIAAAEPYRGPVARLSCLRGISVLSAMVLLAELQDFRRFQHPRDLMAFVGLVPSEHSSGASQRHGSITRPATLTLAASSSRPLGPTAILLASAHALGEPSPTSRPTSSPSRARRNCAFTSATPGSSAEASASRSSSPLSPASSAASSGPSPTPDPEENSVGELERRICGATKGEPSPVLCGRAS
jgi:transposase